jgi:hypothetical protein
MSIEKQRMKMLTRRVAALEDRLTRVSAILEILEYAIKTQRERETQCDQCGRDPSTVESCDKGDECPVGR